MRGIERLVAGALLVMAVTGTAVLARTSAPGGGHAQPLRLQSPPRSNLVAPLPVVVAAPPAAPPRLLTRLAKTRVQAVQPPIVVAQPVDVPPVAAAPAPEPAPAPAPPPPAAPAPAPTPAPSPPAATRVVAAAQPPAPVTTTTKTFGHSQPRGHAWGHVKHAVTTVSTDDAQGDDAPPPPPLAAPPPPPAAPEPQTAPDPGNGNGNGHAYGRSKNGKGD